MTVYLTSDLHVGHINIINYARRPFHSVDNMTKLLVMQWNEVVSPEDTVYLLGDFAMGYISETLPVALDLNGTKYLVPGNHDRCHPMHKKADKWRAVYESVGFTILPEQVRLPVNGYGEILLCHFPYQGDHTTEERYPEWRPVDDGETLLLHGHVHGHNRHYGERMIDVGVDANGFYPRTFEELVANG